jgi:hypothetical protein
MRERNVHDTTVIPDAATAIRSPASLSQINACPPVRLIYVIPTRNGCLSEKDLAILTFFSD